MLCLLKGLCQAFCSSHAVWLRGRWWMVRVWPSGHQSWVQLSATWRAGQVKTRQIIAPLNPTPVKTSTTGQQHKLSCRNIKYKTRIQGVIMRLQQNQCLETPKHWFNGPKSLYLKRKFVQEGIKSVTLHSVCRIFPLNHFLSCHLWVRMAGNGWNKPLLPKKA